MVGVFVFCFLEFLESHEWLRKPITKYYKRSINTDTPGQDSHLFWAVLWFWRRLWQLGISCELETVQKKKNMQGGLREEETNIRWWTLSLSKQSNDTMLKDI